MAVRNLSMSDLRSMIDRGELSKGQTILDQRGLMHLARTEDKLYAEAKGSGSSPYRTSIAFGERDQIKAKCSCRAAWNRPFCKHSAALALAWAKTPEAFVVTETAAEDEARGAKGKGDGEGGPRKRSRAAAAPRVDGNELMKTGAERVDTLVRELAVTGVGNLAGERVAQLEDLAANLRQLRLRRLSGQTLLLAQHLQEGAGQGIDPVRHATLLSDMLLTAAKVTAHCDGKTLEDRYVEELIGRTWLKKDRKPVQGLRLCEYAYAKQTTADDYRVCESRFLELESGEHYTERQILPPHIAKTTVPKASYAGKVLEGAHGGIFPGFAPWRLYMEGDQGRRELTSADVERMLAHALPIATAVSRFQEHRSDLFAPDRMPVFVHAHGLVAQGGRLRIFDEAFATLHLRHSAGIEERMGDALEGRQLRAMLGELDLHHAIPTLWPTTLIVRDHAGLALRPVGAPRKASDAASVPQSRLPKPKRWTQVARDAGLSYAAVSLGELREELGDLLVAGLVGLDARAAEPLGERLRQLKLVKPAELLTAIVAEPDPAKRVSGFVKLFQVLGVALVKLTSAAAIEREGLVPVPTHGSIHIPTPQGEPSPGEVMTARMRGEMTQYEAAVHYHRHYRALDVTRMEEDLVVLADGGAMPYVVDALAQDPARALRVAEMILALPMGTVALRTAFALLARGASPEAELLLKAFSGRRRQAGRQYGQRVVHMADDALLELQRARPRPSPLAESRRDHLANKLPPLLSQARSDKDAHARELGCEALANLGAQQAIPDLRVIFRTDRSHGVREHAAIALGQLGDVRVLEELVLAVGGLKGGAARRNKQGESMARAACRALGYLGDSRALPVMMQLYRDGFTPSVVAEAWLGFGVLALGPILDMVDADPAFAKRSALAAPLAHMPLEFLVPRLLARLAGQPMAPAGSDPLGDATLDLDDEGVAVRANAYLKLCTDHPKARIELARRLLEQPTGGKGTAGKRLLTAARKLVPSG
ncbi:HEAT repeat domain-containing protein [Paraliomyxa miuraensis]|uniref:HEAT repeat domain-containing protein n=1 Tax=Paraliomyxa miuraensis TaxID=376150 RepID=UPI00225088DB|nr:HEAT repeat domain-containing protein [Paraliomyxa miuraensis]MCX4246534.1 HEAT repeat domain-containing protein [Paraliomyxa miuraensis]